MRLKCKVNLEMIPAISPLVFKLLSHPQEVRRAAPRTTAILALLCCAEAVRKKAIVAVHKFFKIVPEAVLDQKEIKGGQGRDQGRNKGDQVEGKQYSEYSNLRPLPRLRCEDQIRKVLCDPDPSVMGASLHVLCEARVLTR
eukprot:Skav221617  [mRNA]  locus=scaffold1327:126969:127391:- [translate_table: standard]